jgi:hypothetical protein
MINCRRRKTYELRDATRRSIDSKKNYKNSWMHKKILKVINNNKDSRYLLFKKVLSNTSANICFDNKPAISKLSKLDSNRLYDQYGSQSFQDIFRNQTVYFRERGTNDLEKRQNYLLSDFFIAVATKLGIVGANLNDIDKLIAHGESLMVFFKILKQLYINNES